jgi:GNAT superfamily N-acetyltransferase
MRAGEYLAWIAAVGDEIVGGAGLHLRRPFPGLRRRGEAFEITLGPHGVVCNVYTERSWRRRGIARRLIEATLAGARSQGVSHVLLHASAEGRPLYEQLGFVPTNEMRYTGAL